jgi:GT2 family glycosyltransferase
LERLVSVSVLSYKRQEALTRVLESLLRQDYPALEIIVVDNASGPELTSFVKERFPQIRLIELTENQGTAARNAGIAAARGEIVVTLDNDVYLDNRHGIREILSAFDRHPQAGGIVFRVYHPATGKLHARDWCHPRPWQQAENQEFETYFITEGAAAYRRSVFDQVEPYWAELFIAHEGFDLALRLVDAGYQIWYIPEVKVWHMASLETRENWRPFYFNTRNLLMVVYRNYPLWAGLMHALPRLAVLGVYGLRYRCLGKYVAGIVDGLRGIRTLRPRRRPVRPQTLRKLAQLRATIPGPLTRFLRHWRKHEF